ncbi:hypothetical protein SCA6_016746 [Theobroma cacao]
MVIDERMFCNISSSEEETELSRIFNDKLLKIHVKRCIGAAIKLRKKYLYKLIKNKGHPARNTYKDFSFCPLILEPRERLESGKKSHLFEVHADVSIWLLRGTSHRLGKRDLAFFYLYIIYIIL